MSLVSCSIITGCFAPRLTVISFAKWRGRAWCFSLLPKLYSFIFQSYQCPAIVTYIMLCGFGRGDVTAFVIIKLNPALETLFLIASLIVLYHKKMGTALV